SFLYSNETFSIFMIASMLSAFVINVEILFKISDVKLTGSRRYFSASVSYDGSEISGAYAAGLTFFSHGNCYDRLMVTQLRIRSGRLQQCICLFFCFGKTRYFKYVRAQSLHLDKRCRQFVARRHLFKRSERYDGGRTFESR